MNIWLGKAFSNFTVLNNEPNAFIYNNDFAIKCRDTFLKDMKD
ncbi:MAG: hypothetical protein ACREV6_15620 [Clostridium sp.]